MTNEKREALIDILTAKREHKISANSQGGYDCRCGARWDWQKSEKLAAERHAAGYLADAILAVFEQAYTPTDDEREVTEGALWGVVERLSLPLTGVEVQALAESVARRTAVQEPQGEPTDAQVLAVLNAWYREQTLQAGANWGGGSQDLSDWSPQSLARARAALRAAFQEGESR